MPQLELHDTWVDNQDVRSCLETGQLARGEQIACERLSTALCDLGITRLRQGQTEGGLKMLEDALNQCPSNSFAFHNLTAALLSKRMLRGNNFNSILTFVAGHLRDFPWLGRYRALLLQPAFANLTFVDGKCNLKCRMCEGSHAPGQPESRADMSPAVFEQVFEAAPTVGAVTLSAGNSDPLLHADLERILDIAVEQGVAVSLFTNGHALSAKACRKLVMAAGMINFSLDAATPETYRRIRGASLDHVLNRIEMLNAMKAETGSKIALSLSFVAMADNIQELPDFVRLALRLSASRVYVEYLNGWDGRQGENLVPSMNPRFAEYVRDAQAAASGSRLVLSLPDRLLHEAKCAESKAPAAADSAAFFLSGEPAASQKLDCCGWVWGLYAQLNGEIEPCCLVQHVADMGNVSDGPLYGNAQYLHVKNLLHSGRVFKECLKARLCPYVQQQLAAGHTPPIITPDELGPARLTEKHAVSCCAD